MAFEAGKMGDGGASGTGNVTTQTHTQFGTRDTDFAQGVVKTEGFGNTMAFEFDAADATAGLHKLLQPTLVAGSRITKVIVKTLVQGVESGTTTLLDLGTEGSEATNGFTLTAAQITAAAGTVLDITGALSGTWDAEKTLVAGTAIGLLIGGGGSNLVTAGKWEVEISYTAARAQ